MRALTDSGGLDHVADGESLDGLVLGSASRAVGASDGLDVAAALLVASAVKYCQYTFPIMIFVGSWGKFLRGVVRARIGTYLDALFLTMVADERRLTSAVAHRSRYLRWVRVEQ